MSLIGDIKVESVCGVQRTGIVAKWLRHVSFYLLREIL